MIENLTNIGVQILSTEKEMCTDQRLLALLMVGVAVLGIVLIVITILVTKLICQYSAFETTVRYRGSMVIMGLFFIGLCSELAISDHAPQMETGRVVVEAMVEEPENFVELSQKYEILDNSKFPIVTFAASVNNWSSDGMMQEGLQ